MAENQAALSSAFDNARNAPLGVSIIIPAYKAQTYLLEAIDSVYEQRLEPHEFEVIVIDDKYPDGDITARAEHERIFAQLQRRIKAEPGKYSNLRIIDSAPDGLNHGAGTARNAGIDAARFRYVAGLDADDLYAFDTRLLDQKGSYLRRGMDALNENPNVAFADCNFYLFGHMRDDAFPNPSNLPWRWAFDPKDVDVIANMAWSNIAMYRREDALLAGKYETSLQSGEDTHFFTKILNSRFERNLGLNVVSFPQAYYMYRQHPAEIESVSRRKMDWKAYETRIIEDCMPFFSMIYGGNNPDVTVEDIRARVNERRIEIGYKRETAFKGITAESLSGEFGSVIKGHISRDHPDSAEFVQTLEQQDFAAALELVHPDLEEMGFAPQPTRR